VGAGAGGGGTGVGTGAGGGAAQPAKNKSIITIVSIKPFIFVLLGTVLLPILPPCPVITGCIIVTSMPEYSWSRLLLVKRYDKSKHSRQQSNRKITFHISNIMVYVVAECKSAV
jgi:hypothetical protein